MKFFRFVGILLLVVIAITFLLVLLLPSKQQHERSITINAAVPEVYAYLARLDNFGNWSGWNNKNPKLSYQLSGADGVLGSVSTWKTDSTEGTIKITTLKLDEEVEFEIDYLRPVEKHVKSEFDLKDVNGNTHVTWQHETRNPRPWNLLNLFKSSSKNQSREMEEGLRNLKLVLEKKQLPVREVKYEVVQMNFPATRFLIYRKEVNSIEIPAFHAEWLPKLLNAVSAAGAKPGIPCGLIFQSTAGSDVMDIASAIPILSGDITVPDSLKTEDINGSKAVYAEYYGSYDKSTQVYKSLQDYLVTNQLKQKFPVIQQFITDPKVEPDSSKWLTRIIFLVE